jgi:hypothetical protein
MSTVAAIRMNGSRQLLWRSVRPPGRTHSWTFKTEAHCSFGPPMVGHMTGGDLPWEKNIAGWWWWLKNQTFQAVSYPYQTHTCPAHVKNKLLIDSMSRPNLSWILIALLRSNPLALLRLRSNPSWWSSVCMDRPSFYQFVGRKLSILFTSQLNN